jgi:hypothetical protein
MKIGIQTDSHCSEGDTFSEKDAASFDIVD